MDTLKKEIDFKQSIIDELESLEFDIKRKNIQINALQNRIEWIQSKLDNIAGDLKVDAQKIVDGEKKMPTGHYRESVTKETLFNRKHKKQC